MCCDDAPDSKPSYMVWVSVMVAIYLCPFAGKVDALALRLANALTDDRMMDVFEQGACDQGIQYKDANGVVVSNSAGVNGGGGNVLVVYDGTLTEFLSSYFEVW